jgi:hypothetical protein
VWKWNCAGVALTLPLTAAVLLTMDVGLAVFLSPAAQGQKQQQQQQHAYAN